MLTSPRRYDHNSVNDQSVPTSDRDCFSRFHNNSVNTPPESPKSLQSQFGHKYDRNSVGNRKASSDDYHSQRFGARPCSETPFDSTRPAASGQSSVKDSPVWIRTTTIRSATHRLVHLIATASPVFIAIRSTPRQRALNHHSHDSVTSTITIRAATCVHLFNY